MLLSRFVNLCSSSVLRMSGYERSSLKDSTYQSRTWVGMAEGWLSLQVGVRVPCCVAGVGGSQWFCFRPCNTCQTCSACIGLAMQQAYRQGCPNKPAGVSWPPFFVSRSQPWLVRIPASCMELLLSKMHKQASKWCVNLNHVHAPIKSLFVHIFGVSNFLTKAGLWHGLTFVYAGLPFLNKQMPLRTPRVCPKQPQSEVSTDQTVCNDQHQVM